MVTCTISGAYLLSDTSGMEAFIEGEVSGVSGTHIFVLPDAGHQKFHIGVLQEGA